MRPKQPTKPKLGRLEKIHPADYWPSAADFQHWLAEAENLELLSEALGFDLQPFEIDDADSGRVDYGLFQTAEGDELVLVAAQPGATEAQHLGHLITWAAAETVSTVVWIAADLAADHRYALEWLNQISQGKVSFLGVEVELWCIGKNAMAVNFDQVSPHPDAVSIEEAEGEEENATEAEEVAPEPEPLTAVQQENLDFWTGLCERMDRLGSLVKPGNPTPAATMGFAIARAGFRLNAILDREHQSLYTELLLSGIDARPHFYLLAHERDLLADEIGLPLIWDDSGEHTCVIASTLSNVDLANRDRWPAYQDWLCDCLERFYEVFFERIKQLDANGYHATPHRRVDPLTDALILPASHSG